MREDRWKFLHWIKSISESDSFAYFFLDKIDMEMLALTHFIKI
jgi:hypothetical protein